VKYTLERPRLLEGQTVLLAQEKLSFATLWANLYWMNLGIEMIASTVGRTLSISGGE